MSVRPLARVNVAAIERNVARLRAGLSGAGLCAVVKADGYRHGAIPVARAAQAAGADLMAWSEPFVAEVAAAAWAPVRMHVKLDSGLGRLGTRDPAEAIAVARAIVEASLEASPELRLVGAMTHFATADEADLGFVEQQLRVFGAFADRVRRVRPGIVVDAANSAATLRVPASHFDMVRCGIAIYGCDPMNDDPDAHGLEPARELSSYVAAVKLAHPGESAGYGRRFRAERETWIGTIPIGYGDGIRCELANNCDVLVNGRRYPLVGTVSMDNITIDFGPDPVVSIGDAATAIGRDGGERQTAEDLARRVGTISYEIVCGISKRVPRAYHRDGEPV